MAESFKNRLTTAIQKQMGSLGVYSTPSGPSKVLDIITNLPESDNTKKNKKEKPKKSENKSEKLVGNFPLNKPIGKIISLGKSENKEATGSGAAGQFSSPLFSTKKGDIIKNKIYKAETKEATGASSAGQYSQPSIWAKSMKKKDWRGASKTQIPGGKFVQVKKKCKTFPYCNQGDIKALKIFENETVKKVITNLSQKYNVNENVIKNIIIYEYNLI